MRIKVSFKKYNKLLEASFSQGNIEKAIDLIVKQIEKRLNVKLEKLSKDKFRKKRNENLYTLKYLIKGDRVDKIENRIISFLWSDREGSRLDRIELFYFKNKKDIDRFTPIRTFEVSQLGIANILNQIIDFWKPHIIFGKSNEDFKKEYQVLLNYLIELGGKEYNNYFEYKGKKEFMFNSQFKLYGYEYYVNLIKKILGMKYDSKYSNDVFLKGKDDIDFEKAFDISDLKNKDKPINNIEDLYR